MVMMTESTRNKSKFPSTQMLLSRRGLPLPEPETPNPHAAPLPLAQIIRNANQDLAS